MKKIFSNAPLFISLIYLTLSILWIFLSDSMLFSYAREKGMNLETTEMLEKYTGYF